MSDMYCGKVRLQNQIPKELVLIRNEIDMLKNMVTIPSSTLNIIRRTHTTNLMSTRIFTYSTTTHKIFIRAPKTTRDVATNAVV